MLRFILDILRALAQPGGPGGELLSARRKSHLLHARWYSGLAQAGEAERRARRQAAPAAAPRPAR